MLLPQALPNPRLQANGNRVTPRLIGRDRGSANRWAGHQDLAGARHPQPRTLDGIDGLSFVHLGSKDVVRHRIVQDIVDAYERADSGNGRSGPGDGSRATREST